MVVHKRIAKAIKKRAPKKLPKIPKIPKVSIPAALRPWIKLGTRPPNPFITGATLGYTIAQQTMPYWGPTVGGIGERMGEETRDLYDWLRFSTETEIDPESAWMIPSGYDERSTPRMPTPRAPASVKRKTSKANIATKKAYAWLLKRHKGKMTQKKCRELLKKAARMASKANPNTKSRIGKRTTKMLKECMKIRKSTWNRSKRY